MYIYAITSGTWCEVIGKPGSTLPEGTPAMDLELKGIRTYMGK